MEIKSKNHEAEETRVWQDGFNEGYIQGMQEMLYRTIEVFFNSKEAQKYKLNKFSAELTNIKMNKENIIKIDKYTNASWI